MKCAAFLPRGEAFVKAAIWVPHSPTSTWMTRPPSSRRRGEVSARCRRPGPQQQLDPLEDDGHHWGPGSKAKENKHQDLLRKRPRCQESKHHFTLGSSTMSFTYLGPLQPRGVSAWWWMHSKARRVLRAIKRTFDKIQIQMKIWCKVFDNVIEPTALYGSEVRGSLRHHGYTRWGRHPTDARHAEFCRTILNV